MTTKPEARLASEGGAKAIPQLGPYPSKLGREELWELIDLWEFSPGNKERIQAILAGDPNLEGPHLFRYYNGDAHGTEIEAPTQQTYWAA